MVNVLAVLWLGFETVNIAWPRESLAPPGAPFYQVWAAPLVLALIAAVGLAYLVRGQAAAEGRQRGHAAARERREPDRRQRLRRAGGTLAAVLGDGHALGDVGEERRDAVRQARAVRAGRSRSDVRSV